MHRDVAAVLNCLLRTHSHAAVGARSFRDQVRPFPDNGYLTGACSSSLSFG